MNAIINDDLKLISQSGLDWEQFKDKTILITGAYGMLASYMVYTLLYLNQAYPSLNLKVLAIGRKQKKADKRFADYLEDPALKIITHDVTEKLKIRGDIDYIIHAASHASSEFFGKDPVGVIAPNIFGTKLLLDLAKEKNSQGFLFFSSGEVCGHLEKDFIEENDSGFLDPTDIRSCYGESKRMAENMLKCWHHQYGIPTFAVRPDHTYGPTIDLAHDRRVFSDFIADILNNRNLTLKSDGKAVRTFCYISDATDAFFRVLLKGSPGQSYNVSNNSCRVSIKRLAETIISIFPDKNLSIEYKARADTDTYLENKNNKRPGLSTKKIEALGYRCHFDLYDGFSRTIRSYL